MTVHVCWSRKDRTYRRVFKCPVEGVRRRFVGWAQDWYSTVWTCCGCGDSFSDGERMERPCARGWRQRAIAKAKADWVAYGASQGLDTEEGSGRKD